MRWSHRLAREGLLELFRRKDLLPRTLTFFSALGDLAAVREALDENANDLAIVNDAFITACRFGHEAVASLLLERAIALDPDLGTHIDGGLSRLAFIETLIEKTPLDRATAAMATALGPWKLFVMGQVRRALDEGDLATFVRALRQDSWLLRDEHVDFQRRLIEDAAVNDREAIHRRSFRYASRDSATTAATAVASHRARDDLREHAPDSLAHAHLAPAG